VPAHLSARLCASLQTHGERNNFLLDTRTGYLKGEKAFAVFVSVQGRSGNGAADLSETAGAAAKAKA